MATLSREQILTADDRKRTRVAIPEWGGEVIVRELSAGGRLELQHDTLALQKEAETGGQMAVGLALMAYIVQAAVVDESDQLLFTKSDIDTLAKDKNVVALTRIAEVARAMSKASEDAIAELGKNSASSQSDSSLFVSP